MGWFDFILENALYYGAAYAMTKNERVNDFVSKQVDKNNAYIDDVMEMREKYQLESKSPQELKQLYQKTDNGKLKNAIKIEISERGETDGDE